MRPSSVGSTRIMLTYNYRVLNTDAMKAAVDAAAKAGIGLTAMKTQGKRQQGEATEAQAKLLAHFIGRGFTHEQACLKVVWEDQRIATICSQMPNLQYPVVQRCRRSGQDQPDRRRQGGDGAACPSHRLVLLRWMHKTSARAHSPAVSPVGDVMRSLMYYHGYGDRELSKSVLAGLPAEVRQRLGTMDFSDAERVCPHRMPIAKLMREAAGLVG